MTQRVAVISDVHGNAVALEAVLSELWQEEPDIVVFGGDLTWGPLPEATLELLRGLTVPSLYVRGNAERALLEPGQETTERSSWMRRQHSLDAIAFLATFAEQVSLEVPGLGAVRFCHGSPRSDEELVTPETPEDRVHAMTADVAERVLVVAHTHMQFDRFVAGIRLINPGSVGLPYEDRPGAYWALLGPEVELRRTEYSLDLAAERYRASGDPIAEEMIEMLVSPPSPAEVIEHAERLEFSG